MNETITLTGKCVYVVFRNDATFYTVLKFKLFNNNEKVITVSGIIPEKPVHEETYTITGNYVEHKKYGMQFAVETMVKNLPQGEEGIVRYFSGVQFPGIGRKTAEKIVDTLGEQCLSLIRDEPEILDRVEGLSKEKQRIIVEGLQEEDEGMQELVRFLNISGMGMRNLVRLNRTYGSEALEKIRENPYRVIEECDGFGFKTADKIGQYLGIEEDDERRLYALLITLCMDLCMRSGDSYTTTEELKGAFEKETQEVTCDFEQLMDQAIYHGQIIEEEDRLYPISQYESEETIASFLSGFPYDLIDPVDLKDVDAYLEVLQKEVGITYDSHQVDAIHTFFKEPFTILTGGPGTGKTTVVRALGRLFQTLYPGATIVCAAPTGRAAKRLSEITGAHALTIHSLLKWDLETNTFGVDEKEPLLADLLIIDEFSMVDNWLFAHLCKASSRIKKICIIGDEDQLPSVSPGSVLRDLIASAQFPLVQLTHIYRQKEGSDVIQLAHQIHEGNADFGCLKNEVKFFECQSSMIRDNTLRIVQNALDKGYELSELQVLSPMYSGPAGIDVLNNALQSAFNPKSPQKRQYRYGYTTFREGDKILQLKNQPDDDVYNGDIGVLVEIEEPGESESHQTTLYVQFEDNLVPYFGDLIGNITLAYCISVHKSQGSEYPIVIMPITSSFSIMLQRKLLYTGITRARKSLVLLGDKEAFKKGIALIERHVRRTTLVQRLKQHSVWNS